MERATEKTAGGYEVTVHNAALVILLLRLIIVVILEEDGEDRWTIEVELLPLTSIKDDDIFDLTVAVLTSQSNEKYDEGQDRSCCCQSL